jgi:hypothetical protein
VFGSVPPPPEPTRLELLADEAGVDYWILRDWLRGPEFEISSPRLK